MSIRCSLIVLTYNGAATIPGCLDSLLPQLSASDELFVVDNGSSDETLSRLAPSQGKIKVLAQARNLGYAAGNNVGLAAAAGQVLILLNQDTVLEPGWLSALLATFEHDPQIGIVGCKSHYPDAVTLQHAGGWVERPSGHAFHFGHGELDKGQYEELRDVEYVSGFAFGIRRAVLDSLGPLDEAFFPAYFEEIDYCFRARATGWRVVYQPAARVLHLHQSGPIVSAYRPTRLGMVGRLRFILRHWSAAELDAWRQWEAGQAAETPAGVLLAAYTTAYRVVLGEVSGIADRRASSIGYGPPWDPALQHEIRGFLRRCFEQAGARLQEAVAGARTPHDRASPAGASAIHQRIADLRALRPEFPGHPVLAPLTAGAKAWIATHVVDPTLAPVWDATQATADHVAALQAEVVELRARIDALYGVVSLLEDRAWCDAGVSAHEHE